jgi:hypothetical protein
LPAARDNCFGALGMYDARLRNRKLNPSDEASFIPGSTLSANGGQAMV